MGKPAARIGDMTMHGGSIVVGCPTVLIGGMPAARLGDMHVCPMMTPGTPPIPHVGGPVSLGSTGVLIGGQPAARMGDMCVCVGPPDSVALGCMTVLIGEAGGGGGGGGGGGAASAASAANASAAVAQQGNLESTTKREHWVEFQFVDKAGLAVSGVPYRFSASDGKQSKGVLRLDGRICRDGLPAGTCSATLVILKNLRWSKKEAREGETVQMMAEVDGTDPSETATFEVWRTDLSGCDKIQSIVEKVPPQGGKLEAPWQYEWGGDEPAPPLGSAASGYSLPQFYFCVSVGGIVARSPLLYYKDYVELSLKDEKGKPAPNTEFIVSLANGQIRKGRLDSSGKAKVSDVPPGKWGVRFEGVETCEEEG